MSDLFLTDTPDGGDIALRNGRPLTTDGLATAVYLSLFTPETWQDAIRRAGERYDSRIPLIKNSRTVNNQTRLALIAAAENALEWITAAAGAQVEVDATIESADLIAIEVTITAPDGSESTTYGVNWSATANELEER